MSCRRALSASISARTLLAVHRGRPLTAVGVLTLLAFAGCSIGSEGAFLPRDTSAVPATVRPSSSTMSSSSGTSDAPGTTRFATSVEFTAEQRAAIDAHDAAIKAIDAARANADPNDPALVALLSKDMLRDTRIDIDQRTKQGIASKRPSPTRSLIDYLSVSIEGPNANLTTCEIDDAVAYRVADGSVVNDDVVTARWGISMIMTEIGWKLAGRHQQATWTGEEMDACRDAV